MQSLRLLIVTTAIVLIITSLSSSKVSASSYNDSSIYEILQSHGLPIGLLPKGVRNFSFGDSGRFEVFLDRACVAQFENELHYDVSIYGTIKYGQIDGLSGISAQDLFLWFPVKEIRVDVPSSGLIYFDVGVVSKQFSLSTFESPRDCLAVSGLDLHVGKKTIETVSKIRMWKVRTEFDENEEARKAL